MTSQYARRLRTVEGLFLWFMKHYRAWVTISSEIFNKYLYIFSFSLFTMYDCGIPNNMQKTERHWSSYKRYIKFVMYWYAMKARACHIYVYKGIKVSLKSDYFCELIVNTMVCRIYLILISIYSANIYTCFLIKTKVKLFIC